MKWIPRVLVAGLLHMLGAAVGSADEIPQAEMPWDIPALQRAPAFRWVDQEAPIRSLLFENEPFNGQQTEVFAFYSTPGLLAGDSSRDDDLPAVVLIHGGGGTAFAEWVQLWAQRGYAAIAMDLSGRRPSAPQFDPETRKLVVEKDHRKIERQRLPNGGPEQGHQEKFENVGGDLSDDWQVHAVSAVLRAHSLIRSFPEVDSRKTAVTGISWGGYLTCLAAALDDRFKAAVPVYGCGFLYEGESVQKPQIEQLPSDKRDLWIQMYDPSNWLPNCRVPILFVNGTNDVHYPLNSYSRTYGLVNGLRQIRIEVNMRHGHPPGWEPPEIGWFIDHHLLGSPSLPVLGRPEVQNERITVSCEVSLQPATAQLHYTTDRGLLSDRQWHSVAAEYDATPGVIHATVPADALIWFVSATDQRGAMTSSEVIFAE